MKKYISIALVSILSIALSGCVTPPKEVEVPAVVGMRHTKAAKFIESRDLVAEAEQGEAAATEELEFIVYEQDPAAGIKVLKGTMIALDYYGEHEEELNYRTDRVYKLVYACPSATNWFGWLDKIKSLGFNTIHTYDPFQWEQEGWWEGEGAIECLNNVRDLLTALDERGMYGFLQMPVQDRNLRLMAEVMATFDNGICVTVEEPDLHVPPQPSLAEQQRYYDTIKEVAPLLVFGCFNGGISQATLNPHAFDGIITDSYPYDAGSTPVPGTLAAETGDISLPWWEMNEWIVEVKIPSMLETIPPGVAVINLQQAMYASSEGHKLPNMMQEWLLYKEAFDLNSFGAYPHGYGQGMGMVCVLDDDRPESYSIQNQCEEVMKMLDEMGGE